ncbi:hypothetical protein QCF01_16720, partial [Staphylococcus aureus]|nr:hypothetical protein [Staphylococcus aureus]
VDGAGVRWQRVAGFTAEGAAMIATPTTAPTIERPGGASPHIVYDVTWDRVGPMTLGVIAAPGLDVRGGGKHRIAVSIDDGAPIMLNLMAGESVENLTRFGGDRGWGMVLSLHAGQQAVLLEGSEYCRLMLPREAVQSLALRLPCRDGLGFGIALDDDISLQLQFDVDVRDSLRQRGPHRRAPST